MGKSFKGFQRHLSVILTIAMILTMMPTTAYADELIGGDSEDILISDEVISDEVISDETVIEEESDALISDDVDTLISDDDSSIDIRKDSSSVADDAEDILDGNTAGKEDIDQDKSTGDVKISLSNNSATTNVKIFDPDSANGDVPYTSPVAWDSTRDFTFTLTPEYGYVLDPDKFKEIKITVVSENSAVIKTIADVASGYTYDTVSGEVTIKKEALGTYKTQGNFKAEIPAGMAKADTYNVTVVGAKVEDEKSLTVSYNGTADISIYANDLNTPITGVKVYTKYDPDDPEKCVSVSSNAYGFDESHKPVSTNVVVKLKAAATKDGYTDKDHKGLTIVAECDKFNITQGADSYGNELKFYQDGKVITSSGYFDKEITVSLNAAEGVTGRELDSVTAVVTYKGVAEPETYKSTGNPAAVNINEGGITATIPTRVLKPEGKKAISVVVTCTTKEVVDITDVDNDKVTIKDLPSGDKKYVETGKDLSFKVEPVDARYIIGDVGYKSGSSSETTKLGKGTGEYKIEDVKNKVAIVVEVIEAKKDTPVALKDSDPEFKVTDFETGIAVSTNGLGFAEEGMDYFFTVTSDKGKAIGSVKYTIGDTSADAEHVEGDKYKIPADRNGGYIYICVKAQAQLVEVKNNNAGKASIYVGSEAKKGSFYVNDNEDLTFTVKPAKNNITLDKVSYKVSTASANEVKKAADGSYTVTIKKNDLKNPVVVNTETTEIADASTYNLTFDKDNNSAYVSENGVADRTKIRLALTDTTELKPVLKNKKGEEISASNQKAEYEPESKGAIVSVNKVANSSTLSANGKAKGSDVINAKLTLSENGNKTIYSGRLNVTVEDHYKVTLNVDPEDPIFVDEDLAKVSGTQNLINAVSEKKAGFRASVTATVSNNVTNAAINNSKVIVKWSSDNGDFAINKTSDWKKLDAEDALTTFVAAKAAGESNVNVIIKDVDGTEYEAEAVTVKAIEEPAINSSNIGYYATIKFDGDKEEQLLSDNEVVELVASTRKSATVKARVVKIEDLEKVNPDTFKSLVSINAALEAKTITDITDNEDITLGYKNGTPAADYYSIDETGKGECKVSITDKGNPIEVQLTIAIKDVLERQFKATFKALKSNAKAQIGIALNDGVNKVTLPATYLEGKDYTTGYDDNPEHAEDGFCFKAEGNTEFVLPAIANNADKKRALIGWQCVSINNVKDTDVKGIYKAGDSFKVPVPSYEGTYKAATMTIKPIWADRVVNTVSNNTPYAVSEMFRKTLSNNVAASLEVSENRIFKVNADDEAGIPISIKLWRNESASGNGTLSPNVVSKNYIFPSDDVEGKGKVTWYAYDESVSANIGENKDYADAVAAAAAVTVVDKAALANGYIKGREEGKAILFAVYEDETGYKWPIQQQYEIEVEDRTTYDVQFNEMPTKVLANKTTTVVNAVKVIIGALDGNEADTSGGTIEWDVDDKDVAAVTSERGELTTAIIEAKKAGTIKVKARYTDKDGVSSAWSQERIITVEPNPYEIKMFNGKGELLENVPTLDVKAGKAISPDLYLTVSKNGAPVKLEGDNKFVVVSTNGILLNDEDAKFDKHLSGNKILSGNELYQLSGNAASSLMDTTNVRVALNIDNSKQFLEIPVRNYYTLTFDGSKSVPVSGNDLTLSESIVNVAINKKASGGLQSVPKPANKDNVKTIDIYAKDLTNGTYNLNLDNWSAVYMNDETGDKTGIVFAGWTEAVKSTDTPVKTTLDKVKTGEYSINGVGSDLVIAPQFKWAPVKNISTDGSTIKIEMNVTDDDATAPKKSIKIATSPSKTGIKVLAETETELSDDIDGFYMMGDGTEAPVKTKSIELTGTEKGNYRESTLTIHTKPGMIGTDTIKISAGNPDVVKNISLNIYGLHKVNVEGEEKIRYKNEDGTLAKKTAVKLTDNTTKYFDEDGNKFDDHYYGTVWNEKQELILLTNGTPCGDKGKVTVDSTGFTYYVVSSNGLAAVSSLKKDTDNKSYYFGPDGKMVTYDATVKNGTPGKYTDGEKSYDIAQDDTAKLSHDHAWKDVWDWTGTNEYGYKVKVTVSCNICEESYEAESSKQNTGDKIKVTTDASSAESVTYKASVSFNGITYKNDKTVPKHKHTWKFEEFAWNVESVLSTHDVEVNAVTAVFKCSVSADHIENKVSENEIPATVKSLAYGSGLDRVTRLIAIVNTNPDNKEEPHREERYYSVSANGDLVKVTKADFEKAAESRIPGTTPSEPSESEVASYKSYNLFLTDNEIEVPGLDEALDAAGITALTGKAGLYFKVAGDDKVELRTPISAADRKNAAKAVNSLIKIDIPADEDGNGGGTFTYQLPVYYQKPVLKLTSTKGTVNIAKTHTEGTGKNAKEVVDDQYFTTTVTEKKSTGAFEPLDLEGLDNLIFVPSGKNGQVEGIFANTNVMGEIVITANAKTAGNISIKLYNWSEPVLLKYSVAKATKDVLTGSTKTILMNSNAAKGDAVQYDQNFTLYVNGNVLSAYEDKDVSVIYPSNWINSGLELKGVANGMLTDDTVTVSFMGDAAQYNKGNYKVKFVTGSGKTKSIYSLKITVSDLALKDKAVNLKTQAKMDLTTGQRMVLIPQLKGISGEISNVEIDEKSAELFECEYNGLLNQIYLSPKEVSKLSIKTKYSVTVNLDVAGVTCSKTINFKPAAKTPTVKIAAVSLKKADFGKRELKAYTNVLATYKVQGKTFSVAPTGIDGVMFTNNKTVKLSDEARTEANLEGEDWYLDGKTNAYVRYDAESGKIEIVTTTSSKTGSVKVRVTFAGGKKVNKSFSIKKVK